MPSISSKLTLTSGAQSSGTALADIDAIKGAFKVFDTYDNMTAIPVSQISNNQIVWVEAVATVYQATVVLADYVSTFTDTVTWAEFTGFEGVHATGDLTAVLTAAASGLLGGVSVGDVNLSVKAGNGVLVDSVGVNVSTGSVHFESGVEKVVIVTTLDGGDI